MDDNDWIEISHVRKSYGLDDNFFNEVYHHNLIIVEKVDGVLCIQDIHLNRLERIIRLHEELEINMAGIDVILNLLDRIQDLESDLFEKDDYIKEFLK